jgi:hypothetical protein
MKPLMKNAIKIAQNKIYFRQYIALRYHDSRRSGKKHGKKIITKR